MDELSTNLQNRIRVTPPFDLEKTIKCGQLFRFLHCGKKYYLPFRESVIEVEQEGNDVLYSVHGKELQENDIRKIFGLNDNIKEIDAYLINRVSGIKEILNYSSGLRIMSLPPYETTISFIFSIQSSIPLIKKRLDTLARIGGASIFINSREVFLFPASNILRGLSQREIGSLRLGFRERFFLDFIREYEEGFFEKLQYLDYKAKRKELMKIKGVGEKVAECIMLFSMGELSAFPVDRWVRRGMEICFGVKGTTKGLTEKGREIFGDFAGYAQEYLYYYMRSKNKRGE